MLAEHSTEITLRARVDFLEEENRQLKEMLGLDDDAGFCVAARDAFDATASQARILQVLVTTPVGRTEALIAACTPSDEYRSHNNMKVQLSRLRCKLARHGIGIKNERGVGYSISAERRSKVLELMAGTVDDFSEAAGL